MVEGEELLSSGLLRPSIPRKEALGEFRVLVAQIPQNGAAFVKNEIPARSRRDCELRGDPSVRLDEFWVVFGDFSEDFGDLVHRDFGEFGEDHECSGGLAEVVEVQG